MMEPNKPEAEIGDKCNINGNCSPPAKNPTIDVNHLQNIDDISTPSELQFDEGIVNNYWLDYDCF